MIIRKYSPFQAKLLAYFWFVLTLAFLFSGYFYKVTVNKVLIDENFRSADEKLDIAISLMKQRQSFEDFQSFYEWLRSNGLIFRLRFTYVDTTGKVLGDSEVPLEKITSMENHINREEIQQALKVGTGRSTRFSETLRRDLIYVAKTCDVTIGDRTYQGVMRAATPTQPLEETFYYLLPRFGISFIGVFALICSVAYLLARRLYGSLEEIINFAKDVAGGDIKKRLVASPKYEFPELLNAINTMADSIETQLNQITETTEKFSTILKEMKEGILLLDKQGKIRMANPFMVKHIIGEATTWEGRYPIELIPSVELQSACKEIIQGRANYISLKLSLGDGNRVYDVNLVRLEKRGELKGAVAVFHDVSDMVRIEKIRKDFIANVSHALRTPLTSIKGYTETLLDLIPRDNRLEQSKTFLEVILRNTEYMMRLVDKLLKLAEVESYTMSTKDFEEIDILEIAEEAWEVCKPIASKKHIELETIVDGHSVSIKGHREQLLTVFQNLYENALRYQPDGIPLKLLINLQNENDILICLEDRGPGIDKVHRERIFERFYQIERGPKKEKNSFHIGLGLAICKHIVKNHGGRIWVEGERGARFCFTLPKQARKDSLV
ncbi:MAG: ATP-binding protein [Syntrophobacterales bacterium]|nr:ATP-binding protein [Syntrophobacterales bacterium]